MVKKELVIYVERFHHKEINTWIDKNIESLKADHEKRGLWDQAFVYLPDLLKEDGGSKFADYLRYLNPRLNRGILTSISNAYVAKDFCQSVYDMLISTVQLSTKETAALLRIDLSTGKCTVDYSTEKGNAEFIEKNYLSRLDRCFTSMKFIEDDEPGAGLSDDLKQTIVEITKNEDHDVLLKFLIYVSSQHKYTGNADLRRVLEGLQHNLRNISSGTQVSSMVVDKHHRIWLPEYNNLEIELHPLPKTLYFLFLQHPNGLRFKQLVDFKDELMYIYGKLSSRMEQNEIERSIDDLIDTTSNSLHEKCSRIKEAFVSKMHEKIAQYYILTGDRGGIKKIQVTSDGYRLTYKPIKVEDPSTQKARELTDEEWQIVYGGEGGFMGT